MDPTTNQQVVVPVTTGGNPKLKSELGKSSSFGVVYESAMIRGLELGISQWHIEETDSIQNLAPQTILNYAGLFPGAVTRAPSCASGPPCPITNLQAGSTNFGDIDVRGIDYDASYALPSTWGVWRVSVNAAQIYRYTASFQPGLPATNRLSVANDSDQDWAPRWKGTVALGWSGGPFAAGVTGRYTGKYRDYEPLADGLFQTLGNFWLFDFNAHLDIGKAFNQNGTWLRNAFVDIGGVNVFNRPPQYSTFYFGTGPGYDALQADIRGRFLYAQFGLKL
jgi:hypothetical protein